MLEQRVEKGIEFLNENMTDWVSRIDLETFDLTDPCRCVLGQLFGRFIDGVDELSLSLDDCVSFGFDTWFGEDENEVDLNKLSKIWKNKISELKNAVASSLSE